MATAPTPEPVVPAAPAAPTEATEQPESSATPTPPAPNAAAAEDAQAAEAVSAAAEVGGDETSGVPAGEALETVAGGKPAETASTTRPALAGEEQSSATQGRPEIPQPKDIIAPAQKELEDAQLVLNVLKESGGTTADQLKEAEAKVHEKQLALSGQLLVQIKLHPGAEGLQEAASQLALQIAPEVLRSIFPQGKVPQEVMALIPELAATAYGSQQILEIFSGPQNGLERAYLGEKGQRELVGLLRRLSSGAARKFVGAAHHTGTQGEISAILAQDKAAAIFGDPAVWKALKKKYPGGLLRRIFMLLGAFVFSFVFGAQKAATQDIIGKKPY